MTIIKNVRCQRGLKNRFLRCNPPSHIHPKNHSDESGFFGEMYIPLLGDFSTGIHHPAFFLYWRLCASYNFSIFVLDHFVKTWHSHILTKWSRFFPFLFLFIFLMREIIGLLWVPFSRRIHGVLMTSWEDVFLSTYKCIIV